MQLPVLRRTAIQGAIALYVGFVHGFLSIPADELVVAAMSIGYEDSAHPINKFRTDRVDTSEVVRTLG